MDTGELHVVIFLPCLVESVVSMRNLHFTSNTTLGQPENLSVTQSSIKMYLLMKSLALNLSTCLQPFILLNKSTRYMICIRTSCSHYRKFVDLTSSDRQSEHFLKKINRARFALARTDSVRSVSGSIFAKPPYRRAASVPLHLVTRTQPPMKGIT